MFHDGIMLFIGESLKRVEAAYIYVAM